MQYIKSVSGRGHSIILTVLILCALSATAFATDLKPDVPDEHSVPKAVRVIIWYFPNLFLDISDIVTLKIGAGHNFACFAQVTNLVQLGFEVGDKYFIEKAFNRQYGGGVDSGYNYGFACVSKEFREVKDTFGTVMPYYNQQSTLDVYLPSDRVFRWGVRDYWAIGARAGWPIMVGAAVHVTEVVDMIGSIFCLDLSGDSIDDSAIKIPWPE